MQKAMSDAANNAIAEMLINFNPLIDPQDSQYLYLEVTREHLVDDTIRELSQYDAKDLKKPLRVRNFSSVMRNFFFGKCFVTTFTFSQSGEISRRGS